MSSEVYFVLELEVQGGGDEFQAFREEMIEATRKETGALSYEWSTSADGTQCHVYERYVDSGALVSHLGMFGERFAERFLQVFKPVRLVVYGAPDSAAREALAPFGPVYMQRVGGFTR
jgi:quinol monooxygenase YgiN